jgi:Tol biopolymer transport system component
LQPADGGRAIQVTHQQGFDGWPYWAADGRSLFFISDRSGSHNIWRIEVDPQSGLPRGTAQQLTSYTDALILHPRPIKGGRSVAYTLMRETTAIHAGATDSPGASRVIARGERPQVAPDGRTVFYVGQGPERGGILAAPIDGGAPRRVTSTIPGGPFFSAFAISPNSRELAYFSKMGAQNVLFTVPAAGGTPRELIRFESTENLTPTWSPDGKLLAYSHGNGLFTIPASGGEPTKRSHLYSWDGWTVSWSPDGEHIAALAWATPKGQNAVFVVPAGGGEARRLTPESEFGYKEGLAWHPDSRRLSYMYYGLSNRKDGSQLAYLDGRPTSLLVDLPNPQWDYVGVWHPAGREFYFISSRDRAWDLFCLDESSGKTRLVVSRNEAEPGVAPPQFSADGKVMVWSVGRSTRQVWTIDLAQ